MSIGEFQASKNGCCFYDNTNFMILLTLIHASGVVSGPKFECKKVIPILRANSEFKEEK